MNTACARTARKSCSRRGWRRCPGPSIVSLARKRWSRACCNDGRSTVESTGLPTRSGQVPTHHYGTIPKGSITAAYIPSLIKMQRRVEFRPRDGRKLIQRHGGSATRRCARLGLAGGDKQRGRQRVFPSRMPQPRAGAEEREQGTPLRGGPPLV